MYLPENIKAIRRKWGESQKDFAARFDMTPSNLSRLENGEHELTLKALVKLSELSNVSMDRLVGERVTSEEIPLLPIGEGGEKLLPIIRPSAQAGADDLGDLADVRKMASAVRALQADMEKLKASFIGLDSDGMGKLKAFEAVQVIIGYLEEGIDESDYLTEKKAYLGRLAAKLKDNG